MLRTFLLTLVIAFPVVGNAANKEPAATKQSRAKDWPGPDVSIKLQNQGKQTAAGKALAECEGTARSLFVQKKYQDALRQYQQCVDLDPKDFQAQFGVGSTLYNLQRYEEGANALRKALELRPENFEVNFWKGMCLARQRKFNEAIPDFEKAHQIKPDHVAARIELFGCYLATQQSQKAFRIFPIIVRVVGGGLMIAYFFGLAVLLVFSLPMRAAALPGFWFSIAWLALFVEGQVALWLLVLLLP